MSLLKWLVFGENRAKRVDVSGGGLMVAEHYGETVLAVNTDKGIYYVALKGPVVVKK